MDPNKNVPINPNQQTAPIISNPLVPPDQPALSGTVSDGLGNSPVQANTNVQPTNQNLNQPIPPAQTTPPSFSPPPVNTAPLAGGSSATYGDGFGEAPVINQTQPQPLQSTQVVDSQDQTGFNPVISQATGFAPTSQQAIQGNFESIEAINSTKKGIKKAIIIVLAVIIIGGGGFFLATKFLFSSTTDYSELVSYKDDSGYTLLVPKKWHKVDPEDQTIDLAYADEIAGEGLDESMAVLAVGLTKEGFEDMYQEYNTAPDENKRAFLNIMWGEMEAEIKKGNDEINTVSVDHDIIKHQATDMLAVLATIKGTLKKDERISVTSKVLMFLDGKTGYLYFLDVDAHDTIWENKDNEEAFNRIINEFEPSSS